MHTVSLSKIEKQQTKEYKSYIYFRERASRKQFVEYTRENVCFSFISVSGSVIPTDFETKTTTKMAKGSKSKLKSTTTTKKNRFSKADIKTDLCVWLIADEDEEKKLNPQHKSTTHKSAATWMDDTRFCRQ